MTATFGIMVGAVLLAVYAAVAAKGQRWMRALAVAVGLAAVPAAFYAESEALSKPKPVALEWWLRTAPEATVLGASLREGVGIFLLLQLSEVPEPRYYVLPWSRELAEQLQEALREAEEGGSVQMRAPFEPSLDPKEPKFYAPPQPTMPQKRRPPEPKRFEQPA